MPVPPASPHADINASLEKIVAESKPSNTAAGTGLSGARHAGASDSKSVNRGASGSVSSDASTSTAPEAVDIEEGIREELNVLVDRVKGLRKVTAEATLFLPVYDLRRAEEVRSPEFSAMRRCDPVDRWIDREVDVDIAI